ncbi:hypothetical protein C8A00DRAFT_13942 [Chaetomidium leptoderma]|uniref:SMODS and SLOG-associating 2TM effector domain-containing protein n=1 Tax=Chaetomidium leptoderma TaxID=669021 RepID=A0AAN6ZWW5_9PEZI|nr:hypothetical protein C8A00DRAFT_13942 [Chaetomidium leptoderma]
MSNTAPPLTTNQKSPIQVHTAEQSSPAPDTEPSLGAGSTVGGSGGGGVSETDHATGTARHDDNGSVGLGFRGPIKADTDLSWGAPAGLHIRRFNDENLTIFRRAVGINTTFAGSADPQSLEEGRRKSVGLYRSVLGAVRNKMVVYHLLSLLINACHFAQIIIGASLTALGPTAGNHVIAITFLGAVNTVIAGMLALIKGQGLPARINHDRAEFRRLQDWIEQTEALLAVGVIGRDRKEVGVLVQSTFRKYNAAKQCEENNAPDSYTRPPDYEQPGRPESQGSDSSPSHHVKSPSLR